jgi:hypothetical protein
MSVETDEMCAMTSSCAHLLEGCVKYFLVFWSPKSYRAGFNIFRKRKFKKSMKNGLTNSVQATFLS